VGQNDIRKDGVISKLVRGHSGLFRRLQDKGIDVQKVVIAPNVVNGWSDRITAPGSESSWSDVQYNTQGPGVDGQIR
jgi:hypothetical protein